MMRRFLLAVALTLGCDLSPLPVDPEPEPDPILVGRYGGTVSGSPSHPVFAGTALEATLSIDVRQIESGLFGLWSIAGNWKQGSAATPFNFGGDDHGQGDGIFSGMIDRDSLWLDIVNLYCHYSLSAEVSEDRSSLQISGAFTECPDSYTGLFGGVVVPVSGTLTRTTEAPPQLAHDDTTLPAETSDTLYTALPVLLDPDSLTVRRGDVFTKGRDYQSLNDLPALVLCSTPYEAGLPRCADLWHLKYMTSLTLEQTDLLLQEFDCGARDPSNPPGTIGMSGCMGLRVYKHFRDETKLEFAGHDTGASGSHRAIGCGTTWAGYRLMHRADEVQSAIYPIDALFSDTVWVTISC